MGGGDPWASQDCKVKLVMCQILWNRVSLRWLRAVLGKGRGLAAPVVAVPSQGSPAGVGHPVELFKVLQVGGSSDRRFSISLESPGGI